MFLNQSDDGGHRFEEGKSGMEQSCSCLSMGGQSYGKKKEGRPKTILG